jgi:hypothetical protein
LARNGSDSVRPQLFNRLIREREGVFRSISLCRSQLFALRVAWRPGASRRPRRPALWRWTLHRRGIAGGAAPLTSLSKR